MKADLRHFPVLAVTWLVFFALASCHAPFQKAQLPQANKGVLDLRFWNFEKNGPANLDGQWSFYWKQLISPQYLSTKLNPATDFINTPGIWNSHEVAGVPIRSDGYATYHLRVLLAPQYQQLGLHIPDMATAYRLYVNGELVQSNGVVGTELATMQPQVLPLTGFFAPPADNTLDIVIQVSNFYLPQGGMWRALRLGTGKQIQQLRESNIAFECLLIGLVIVMAIYHILLFLLRREEASLLYFGLYSLLVAGNCFIQGERFLLYMCPWISWRILLDIVFVANYLSVPLMGFFLRSIFPQETPRSSIQGVAIMGVLCTIFGILAPVHVATQLIMFYLMFLMMMCAYYLTIVFRALLNKREGAWFVFAGFVPLVLTAINDILQYMNIYPTYLTLLPVGLSISIFTQAYMLSIRFAKAFHQEEHLSRDLAQTKNYLGNVFNSLSSLLISVDRVGKVTQWNTAAERYTGFPSSWAIGRPVWEVFPIMGKFYNEFAAVICTGRQVELTNQAVPTSEGVLYINIFINPLLFEKKKGAVIRIDDVTELESKNVLLRQAQKMEAVGNLANGLAHDFNNILGGIMGMISLLRYYVEQGVINPKTMLSSIDSVERSTDRATELVKQLLSLSRKHELTCTPVDLNTALQQVVKICQNTFDKSIEIKMECYGQPAVCMADQGQIEQVILNLCLNAAHAMTTMRTPGAPLGGVLFITIRNIRADFEFCSLHQDAKEGAYWVFSVRDTGVGIEAKYLDKIFDPFFTTKENGTGLGLAMVYTIVSQHGGFVDVSSELGLGASFDIYLPVYEGMHDPDIQTENMEEYPHGFGLVLVIDDEDIIRMTARNILEEGGYSVITAADGEEGVRIFREHRNQIKGILLDMVMPRMSGKDAFIEIKKIDPNAIVLLTSGFEQDPRVQDVLALGAQGFIRKPYSMVGLLKKFQELFENCYPLDPCLSSDRGTSSYF